MPDPAADRPKTPGGALSVLIVDDEPSIRLSLGRFLEVAGYAVMQADDVDPALKLLQERTFAGVILDIGLPSRSGIEVLAFLRAALKDTPVLVLTGAPLTAAEETLARQLKAEIFYKPEGYAKLVRHLDQITGHSS